MKGKHVSADFLTAKLSKEMQEVLVIVQRVIILVLLAFIFVGAIVLQPKMAGHSSTNLDIPKNFYYLPILLIPSMITGAFCGICVKLMDKNLKNR